MITNKEYQEVVIYNSVAVNEKSMVFLNEWLAKSGVRIEIIKDTEKVVVRIFKDYGKYDVLTSDEKFFNNDNHLE